MFCSLKKSDCILSKCFHNIKRSSLLSVRQKNTKSSACRQLLTSRSFTKIDQPLKFPQACTVTHSQGRSIATVTDIKEDKNERKDTELKEVKNENAILQAKSENTALKEVKKEESSITKATRWLKDLVGYSETEFDNEVLVCGGTLLIWSAIEAVDYDEIFEQVQLPDTFDSFFKVLELHVWMLMQRLKCEGQDGEVACNALIKAMWKELGQRIGRSEITYGEWREGAEYYDLHFKSMLGAYDEGLLLNDDTALAAALWKGFFTNKEVDPRHLQFLVTYSRQQMLHLRKFSRWALLCGMEPVYFLGADGKRFRKKEIKVAKAYRQMEEGLFFET